MLNNSYSLFPISKNAFNSKFPMLLDSRKSSIAIIFYYWYSKKCLILPYLRYWYLNTLIMSLNCFWCTISLIVFFHCYWYFKNCLTVTLHFPGILETWITFIKYWHLNYLVVLFNCYGFSLNHIVFYAFIFTSTCSKNSIRWYFEIKYFK